MKFLSRTLIISSLLLSGTIAQAQFCFGDKKTAPPASSNLPLNKADASVDPNQVGYERLDDAALAALKEAGTLARNMRQIEFGGCLFATGTGEGVRFFFTKPQTNNSNSGVRISCERPPNAPIFVAMYHTHPEDQSVDGYSGHDIEVAETMNITSYLGSMRSGAIAKFESCKTPKRRAFSDRSFGRRADYFSTGEIIGKMF